MLLAALVMGGCSMYHYVDTCTRSQLVVSDFSGGIYQIPSLNDPNEQCNKRGARE